MLELDAASELDALTVVDATVELAVVLFADDEVDVPIVPVLGPLPPAPPTTPSPSAHDVVDAEATSARPIVNKPTPRDRFDRIVKCSRNANVRASGITARVARRSGRPLPNAGKRALTRSATLAQRRVSERLAHDPLSFSTRTTLPWRR